MSVSELPMSARRQPRGLVNRVAVGMARIQRLVADAILPLPGGHPATTFRQGEQG
jgi:hypothetical protein